MEWYKHHIADYMEATRELNMLQDGAYRRILDVYYQQEGPLKVDERVIFRLINALHWREKEAARYVLGKFFVPIEGYYHNTRADEEIVKYQARGETNRRNSNQRFVNHSTIESIPRIERKNIEKNGPCSELLENGEKCGVVVGTTLVNHQWVCRKHHPYL